MKRILTTVVAVAAVLSIGTVANAALYDYDLAANGSTVVTLSEYSPAPCPGGYPATCFVNPLSAGSSLTLDITGSDVTVVSSNLEINVIVDIVPGSLTITTDVTGVLTGGTGTLVGSDILWTSPASYSSSGTLVCTGSLCGVLVPLNDGQVYDISVLGGVPVPNPFLGTWSLSGDLSQILGSSRHVTDLIPPGTVGAGTPAGWLVYGAADLGFPVPEPGSMALVLLGLGGLALRARKA